jgi:hypothetical protein
MNVETHAFRDAFVAEKSEGFALQFDDLHSRAWAGAPFVTQKHDDKHLCMFVFETAEAAEKEKEHFPATAKLTTKQVSLADVRTFAATGYFGTPALVFLRDRAGASALL